MCRKLFFLTSLVLVMSLASKAPAEDREWVGGNDGDNWCHEDNWDPVGIPTPDDTAIGTATPERGPIVGPGCNVDVNNIHLPNWVSSGTQVMDVTGGTIKCKKEWRWSNDGDTNGVINISGGDVNVVGNFRWGDTSGGHGIVRISGGIVRCGELKIGDNGSGILEISGETTLVEVRSNLNFTCGDDDATVTFNMTGGLLTIGEGFSAPGSEDGDDYAVTINLDGGTIECGSFSHAKPYHLDIDYGELKIKGDVIAEIQEDIALGYITSFDKTGTPSVGLAEGWTVVSNVFEQTGAYDPKPTDKKTEVCPSGLTLSWTPGIKTQDVNAHEIYFGTDYDIVSDANLSEPCGVYMGAQDSNVYPEVGTLDLLELGKTYYWRVDEVNEDDPNIRWKGTVWQFTAQIGKASNPDPENDFRGYPAASITALSWKPSCVADTHKLYYGPNLPGSIVLFDDDFESGAFEPNWAADPNWEVWDANDDPNYADYDPHDHNLARIVGSSGTLAMNVDANTTDACSVNIKFDFRKTGEIRDGDIEIYYWDGNAWDFIKDLNSLDPNDDQWIGYSDDVNVNDEYHLQTDFKIKFVADINDVNGIVHIDNVKITNTWPAAAQWYKGREDSNSYSVSVQPFSRYYWRIDTIVDGNTIQGDHWSFRPGLGGVIMWLTFDGALNNDIEPPVAADTETSKTIEFAKYTEAGGSVKYGQANTRYNREGTSAVFDPNAGLYRLDPCKPSQCDPLRLDGYQYTIEMWVKPMNLSEPLMDDQVVISKGGDWEDDDDGDEWSSDSWCLLISNPGTDDEEDDNNWRFRHAGDSLSMENGTAVEDEWSHVAAVCNQKHPDSKYFAVYYNGDLDDFDDDEGLNPPDNNSPVSIGFGLDSDGNFANLNCYFQGFIDEIRILDIALDPDEFLLTPGPEWASGPNPGHREVDVDPCDPNVVLSWRPGIYADKHKVYFSTDFDDVNTGSLDAYLGQFDNNEVPNNQFSLEFGKVYYWRVDEVNDNPGAPAGSPWEGVVWKFTSKFILEDVDQVLRYRFDQDSGDDVVDSSGYGKHGQIKKARATTNWGPTDGHDVGCLKFDDDTSVEVPDDTLDSIQDEISISVWLYGVSRDTGDNWVLQAGSGAHSLDVLVPDVNGHVCFRAGNDTNDVVKWEAGSSTVKAWRDNWHHFVFIKDETEDKMSIYFDGELKWWKEDTTSSLTLSVYNRDFRVGAESDEDDDYEGWIDDLRVYKKALSDVNVLKLFRGGELDVAWGPNPYDGQPDATWDANLGWKPGDDANSHKVFFGRSEQQVANMTDPCATKELGDEDYDPGPLVLDKYYYWRIDEVNGPCTWPGPVWTFKVADFKAIDDFESYNKTTNQIKDTWRDYWYQSMNPPYTPTGGVLDLGVHPYDVVYPAAGGTQSMLYQYRNILWTPSGPGYASVCYSEVSLPLPEELQNWTVGGVRVLRLFFYGDVDNDVNAPLYVGVKDGGNPSKYAEVRYGEYDPNNEDMNDVNEPEWHRWDIGLTHFKDSNFVAVANDVDLTNIAELLIGFGDRRNPVCGPEGVVIFDDIRLYMPICKPEFGPLADFSGNCIVDMADIGIMAGAWLRHDANFGLGGIQEPNDANLVGWWRLDGDPNDSSTYDHNSTIEGDYSWVTGHNDVNVDDLAVQFGSSGGRILVEDSNDLKPKHQVSASAWVYFTESQNDARVVVKGQNDKETYAIEIDDKDEFEFNVRDANGNEYSVPDDDDDAISENIWTDDWIHLAGTYDGNSVKGYVNGELFGSTDANFVVAKGWTLSQNTKGLAIGSKAEELDGEFEGTVDEVRVYNYALSEAEVRWLTTDGTGYLPLTLLYNLYDKEVPGKQAINFKDFAMLLEDWLKEGFWPPE